MDQDRMSRQGQVAGAISRPRLAAIATLLVVTVALAAFLVLGSSASTQAVSASSAAGSPGEPITGKLSKPGYTVIALARTAGRRRPGELTARSGCAHRRGG